MADKKTLVEEVKAELDINDDPDCWDIAYKFLIIFLCCMFLTVGLAFNGVVFPGLFGVAAFFGLVWLGRDHV